MKIKLIELLKIILLIALVIIGVMVIPQIVAGIEFAPLKNLSSELMAFLITLGFFALFTQYWDKIPLSKSVLLKEKGKLTSWAKGCLIGIVMIGITIPVLIIPGWINIERTSMSFAAMIFPFITMLFAAFWEELLFRGWALNKLQFIVGKHAAAIVIALIFASLHLLSPLSSPQIVISTFFSGLLLNYAFLQKQSLYFPIGIHFAWNAFNNLFFGESVFHVDYINEFMAGINNPEQGFVAIVITALAWLYVMRMRPTKR